YVVLLLFFFFFSSRRRHTRWPRDWSSDVCSSDLLIGLPLAVWLYQQGQTGWAIFLAVWMLGVVGTIDNVLKPLLIGKRSSLPVRSEERRVGKECRCRWAREH